MSDFCKVPEQALAEAATNLCRWPDGNVPWTLQALLPGLTEDEMVALLQPYFSRWRRVKVWYVERAAEARVLVGARHIDGVNGVLADCYLPCGNVKSVKLQFDLGDNWTPEKLGQTAWHEFGHGIGISHAPAGSRNIMAPSLNMAISECGEWDLLEEKRRYPAVMPPPLPPTKVVLNFKGKGKSVAATLQGQQVTVVIEGAVTDVTMEGATLPPPIVPPNGGGMNFFWTLISQFAKSWLDKAIADGTLQKWLEELLKRFASGQVKNAEQLVVQADESLKLVQGP